MKKKNSIKQLIILLRIIQCKIGLCAGYIDHEQDLSGVWWIGLRCTATGTLHDPIKSKFQDY